MLVLSVKPPSSGRSRGANAEERSDVHYFRSDEQFERWRKQFAKQQDDELKLATVSKLSYDPPDYQSMLIQTEFPEQKITDYNYLIDRVKIRVETKYFYPVATRIGAIILFIGVLVVLFSPVTLLIMTAVSVAAAVSLYFTIRDREAALKQANEEALAEIARRHQEERLAYDTAKHQHEEQEHTRINMIERLLSGDPGAVKTRLDEVLSHLKMPVVVEVDIDVHMNIPLAQIWLPPNTVIPRQTCELLPSGRIQFQDKDGRIFNKQYFELCAAIVLQVMSTIFANIPSFQEGYAAGIIKNELNDDCIIAIKVLRETLESVCRCDSGITALQAVNANYKCDTMLELYPVDMLYPPEWKGMEQKPLRVHVRIFK